MKKLILIGLLLSLTAFASAEISIEGEPVLGEKDAEVTLTMYEDLQCPFCKRFEDEAFPRIKENYIETGKVKAVWKDRPLPELHPWGKPGAEVMECVFREGGNDAFWPVKSKIYANQNAISTSNVKSKIKEWASEEGVSKDSVQSCLDNGNPMEEVEKDIQEAEEVGASGTPTIFVNDKKIVGAQPYQNFEDAIEKELDDGSDSDLPEKDSQEEKEEEETEPEDSNDGESGDRYQKEDNADQVEELSELKETVDEQEEELEEKEERIRELEDEVNELSTQVKLLRKDLNLLARIVDEKTISDTGNKTFETSELDKVRNRTVPNISGEKDPGKKVRKDRGFVGGIINSILS